MNIIIATSATSLSQPLFLVLRLLFVGLLLLVPLFAQGGGGGNGGGNGGGAVSCGPGSVGVACGPSGNGGNGGNGGDGSYSSFVPPPPPPPPPSITFTASPQRIGPGSSSNLSWSVIGATSCTASGASEWTGNKSISGGSENVSPAVTTSYHLSCTGDGGTTVSTVTVTLPTGSIAAGPPCIIPAGLSSCNVRVFWSSANFLGAASILQGTTILTSGPRRLPFFGFGSRRGVIAAVNPDNNRFTLIDTGSSFEVSTSAGVSCATGSVWVTGTQTCTLLPIINLQLIDSLVRSGNSARFSVNITANYDLQCLVTGGLNYSFTHLASPTVRSYAKVTDPLTYAQIVRVECTSVPHPVLTGSAESRINVVPGFREI